MHANKERCNVMFSIISNSTFASRRLWRPSRPHSEIDRSDSVRHLLLTNSHPSFLALEIRRETRGAILAADGSHLGSVGAREAGSASDRLRRRAMGHRWRNDLQRDRRSSLERLDLGFCRSALSAAG